MNDRPGNRHFCPRDAEYGQYTGIIQTTSPAHPVFERILEDDPLLIEGWTLIRHPYPDSTEHIGTIAEYSDDQYRIESDTNEPFEWTEHYISREKLFEYLWTPDGPNDLTVPDELCLGVRRP